MYMYIHVLAWGGFITLPLIDSTAAYSITKNMMWEWCDGMSMGVAF